MEPYKIALPIIVVSVLIGLSTGLWFNESINNHKFSFNLPSISDKTTENNQSSELGRLGSAHEHASFHVIVNGSEKDFTDRRFQLNSRYVHLEGNKSDIVHKHAKGVTWEMFFQTINLSTSNENQKLCLKIYDSERCGNGSMVLNGEFNASAEKKISQGDNLLIILDTKEWRNISKKYMKKQLPEEYRPQNWKGRSI